MADTTAKGYLTDLADTGSNRITASANPGEVAGARGWRALTVGQAFAIHLSLSLLAFSTLVAMMILFWFPGELFFIDGGIQGLKLVAMVDLVLGPSLTLILYRPGKPKLLLDMSLIAMVQISALTYGFYTTWHQRTVAVVFADNSFQTVSANAHEQANRELVERDIEPRRLASAGLLQTHRFITPAPGPGEFGSYLADLLNGYPEPHERSDQYVAFDDEHYDSIRKAALDDKALAGMKMEDQVGKALTKQHLTRGDVDIFSYKTRFSSGVALVDPDTLAILDFVPKPASSAEDDATTDIAETEATDGTDHEVIGVASHEEE
ncbi:MAG: hypothetical protein CSB44_04665 [Gammaproteobacteria bacterium]|nr:MAG: hypothetical protein CSB44_04665 [Gammaproteobacteria bacterium]